MELKVLCDCGQKYAFDVEPVGGRMPVRVNCPGCGVDGTDTANGLLAQHFPAQPPPLPVPVAMAVSPSVAPATGGLRISHAASAAPSASPVPPRLPQAPRAPALAPSAVKSVQPVNEFNMGLGILGAIIGAVVGGGLMFGISVLIGFKFPLMGTCIGALTGLGARILYKGTDSSLGAVAAVVALVATAGTMFLLFGFVSVGFIFSMIASVYFAYRIAS